MLAGSQRENIFMLCGAAGVHPGIAIVAFEIGGGTVVSGKIIDTNVDGIFWVNPT